MSEYGAWLCDKCAWSFQDVNPWNVEGETLCDDCHTDVCVDPLCNHDEAPDE